MINITIRFSKILNFITFLMQFFIKDDTAQRKWAAFQQLVSCAWHRKYDQTRHQAIFYAHHRVFCQAIFYVWHLKMASLSIKIHFVHHIENPASYILCMAQKMASLSIKLIFCARHRKRRLINKLFFVRSNNDPTTQQAIFLCAAQKMTRLSIKLYFVCGAKNGNTLHKTFFSCTAQAV